MLTPEMEARLMEVAKFAAVEALSKLHHFKGRNRDDYAQEVIADAFRPLIADLEAKVQTARAEALEEAVDARGEE